MDIQYYRKVPQKGIIKGPWYYKKKFLRLFLQATKEK